MNFDCVRSSPYFISYLTFGSVLLKNKINVKTGNMDSIQEIVLRGST